MYIIHVNVHNIHVYMHIYIYIYLHRYVCTYLNIWIYFMFSPSGAHGCFPFQRGDRGVPETFGGEVIAAPRFGRSTATDTNSKKSTDAGRCKTSIQWMYENTIVTRPRVDRWFLMIVALYVM